MKLPQLKHRLIAVLVAAFAILLSTIGTDVREAAAFTNNEINVSGHGYGHGRGLGQYGALGYALNSNYSYTQILSRFYSNTAAGTTSNKTIAVRIMEGDGGDSILGAKGDYKVDGSAFAANRYTLIRRSGANTFKIYRGNSCSGPWGSPVKTTTGTVQIDAPDTTPGNSESGMLLHCVAAGTRAYRGYFRVVDDGTTQHLVNRVTIETYLKGVVPRESPASWADLGGGKGINALRAQAVAARSYALSEHRYSYATTCDTTSCQVYGGAFLNGVLIEDARSNQAVSDTAGKIRTLSGNVARTEFSSSTGGYSAGGTFPAVSDSGDSVAQNPNHDWSATISVNTIESRYPTLGDLQDVNILSRNGNGDMGGRVLTMELVGSDHTVSLTGDDFRSAFGLKSNWFELTGVPSGDVDGYWIVARNGGVVTMGNGSYYGNATASDHWVVAGDSRPQADGYWLVSNTGEIFSPGAAVNYGDPESKKINKPIVGLKSTPSGNGYWMVGSGGKIYNYGDAAFFGDTRNTNLHYPIVGMEVTPNGGGYWLVGASGKVYPFGNAVFFGDTRNKGVDNPIIGIVRTPAGQGYWLAGSTGKTYSFGTAQKIGNALGAGRTFRGFVGAKSGYGYGLVSSHGTVYTYGSFPDFGGMRDVISGYSGQTSFFIPSYVQ